MNLLEYARIADIVYNAYPESIHGFHTPSRLYRDDVALAALARGRTPDLLSTGLQGRVFVRTLDPECVVIAFKGTRPTQLTDLLNDVDLTLGVLPSQAVDAIALTRRWLGQLKSAHGGLPVHVVGHSLGGAIAQCVAYALDLRCVTFNAPGMLTVCRMWLSRGGRTPVEKAGENYRSSGLSPIANLFWRSHVGSEHILDGSPSGHGIAGLADWLERTPALAQRTPFGV
jgi:pimeloyl-ACP methyl ester carboxylesterase